MKFDPQEAEQEAGRICDDCHQGMWSKIRMSRDRFDEVHANHNVREVTYEEYEAHYGRGPNVTTTNQPRPQGWVDAHISSQALQDYETESVVP